MSKEKDDKGALRRLASKHEGKTISQRSADATQTMKATSNNGERVLKGYSQRGANSSEGEEEDVEEERSKKKIGGRGEGKEKEKEEEEENEGEQEEVGGRGRRGKGEKRRGRQLATLGVCRRANAFDERDRKIPQSITNQHHS
jgi:hypothetical protein